MANQIAQWAFRGVLAPPGACLTIRNPWWAIQYDDLNYQRGMGEINSSSVPILFLQILLPRNHLWGYTRTLRQSDPNNDELLEFLRLYSIGSPIEPRKSTLRATAKPFHAPGGSGHKAATNSSSPPSNYTPTSLSELLSANASIASSRTTPTSFQGIDSTFICPVCSTSHWGAVKPIALISNWTRDGKKAGKANIWERDNETCPYSQDRPVNEYPFPTTPFSSENRSHRDGEQSVQGPLEPDLIMSDEEGELLPKDLRGELGIKVPFVPLDDAAYEKRYGANYRLL